MTNHTRPMLRHKVPQALVCETENCVGIPLSLSERQTHKVVEKPKVMASTTRVKPTRPAELVYNVPAQGAYSQEKVLVLVNKIIVFSNTRVGSGGIF